MVLPEIEKKDHMPLTIKAKIKKMLIDWPPKDLGGRRRYVPLASPCIGSPKAK